MKASWAAWTAVVLVLAGCTSPAGPSPVAPARTAASPASAAAPESTATSATPSVPATASTPPPVQAAMPASDDRPMLWPAARTVQPGVEFGGGEEYTLYGFVDVHGRLVVPERFDSYLACPDAKGRTAFVVGSSAGHHDEVLDLTGGLLARTPTGSSECGGAGHVITTKVIDGELGKYNSGLLDVTSGKMVVPIAKNRHLQVVDANTVNVSDPSGEYFLDLTTRRRTPHSGFLLTSAYPGDGTLLAASPERPPGGEMPDRVGFIDRSGAWVGSAGFEDASGFSHGFASVVVDGKNTFVNTRLQRVGGTWDEVTSVESSPGVVVGYQVARDGFSSLLGADLHVIVPPAKAEISCGWDAGGACVVPAAGGASLLVLPAGTATAMPDGFRQALSTSFLADEVASDDGSLSVRLYATATGTTVTLPSPAGCFAVGADWAACNAGAGMAPPIVVDTSGRVTGFATAQAVADPSPDAGTAYYWVTAGRYQGFVDAAGTWHYRENRYTELED